MENGALAAARTAKTGRKKIVMTDSKEEFSVGMWGRGDEFQLGSGERGDRMLPLTMMFTKVQITSVACGSKHTIVLLGPSHAPRVTRATARPGAGHQRAGVPRAHGCARRQRGEGLRHELAGGAAEGEGSHRRHHPQTYGASSSGSLTRSLAVWRRSRRRSSCSARSAVAQRPWQSVTRPRAGCASLSCGDNAKKTRCARA